MSSDKARQSVEHSLAALYQRSVLDPLIEIARGVSHDFVERPRHYRAVPEKVAELLEGFRIRSGSSPEWLSKAQRSRLFVSLFGGAFCGASVGLRSAAVAFVDRGTDQEPDLLGGFRDAAIAFRGALKFIEGRVVTVADSETAPVFRSAIEVLRSEVVAGAFGLPAAPGGNWPLDGALQADVTFSDGAHLVEEMQRALGLSYIRPALSQHRFVQLQRVAHYGSATIAGALDETAEWGAADQIRALARNAYGWEKALQALLFEVDMVCAWKDPSYRQGLSPCEKAMIGPHPSGEVNLKDTQLDPVAAQARMGIIVGGSTMTLGSICCCTGNLPCPQDTEGQGSCGTCMGFTCYKDCK